jgi:amidase
MDWHKIAERAQSRALDAIPQPWRLPAEALPTQTSVNVLDVPRTCGLLSIRQLEITELTATEVLGRIAEGQVTSVEATEAFCIRAAIAHQLVRSLWVI